VFLPAAAWAWLRDSYCYPGAVDDDAAFWRWQAKAQRDVYRAYVGYLESVRRMCICAWARFDLLSIGLGMGLLALSCACMVLTFSAGIEGNDDLRS
jgi:hypothetical protein